MTKEKLPDKVWLNGSSTWITDPESEEFKEYIQKDVFLKKACIWLNTCLPSYIAYCNNVGVVKGTTEYVNDFKAAMEKSL